MLKIKVIIALISTLKSENFSYIGKQKLQYNYPSSSILFVMNYTFRLPVIFME